MSLVSSSSISCPSILTFIQKKRTNCNEKNRAKVEKLFTFEWTEVRTKANNVMSLVIYQSIYKVYIYIYNVTVVLFVRNQNIEWEVPPTHTVGGSYIPITDTFPLYTEHRHSK